MLNIRGSYYCYIRSEWFHTGGARKMRSISEDIVGIGGRGRRLA